MIILYLTQLKILRGQVNDNPIFDTIKNLKGSGQ